MVKRPVQNFGFTLIELIIGVAVFLTLLALTWINLGNLPSKVTINTSYQEIINDLRNQQSMAMNGASGYGIYIGESSYTLFKGDSYDVNNSTNFIINLQNSNLKLTSEFLDQEIVFSGGSGEIKNFDSLNNTLTLTDELTGETKTVILNKYGVPI